MVSFPTSNNVSTTFTHNCLRSDGLHFMPENDASSTTAKFDMEHRQMRPDGMHFALHRVIKNDGKMDDVTIDTMSTSSTSSCCSDDSSAPSRSVPSRISVERYTSSSDDSSSCSTCSSIDGESWEDRAVSMERNVVCDLYGTSAPESMSMLGRWTYKAPRRALTKDASSWITKK